MPSHPVCAPAARRRPEIESSWARSRLNGLRQDVTPRLDQDVVNAESNLSRAAGPVLDHAQNELLGVPVGLVLANHTAHVLDVRFAEHSDRRAVVELGVVPGARLSEDQVGTNAVGTPLETKQGLLVHGPEHYMAAFQSFSCYGHPIIHPITRRLAGVLNIGGRSSAQNPLFPALVRRLVRDIEARLQLNSSSGQRRLLAEFQTASRRRGRAVVVVGKDLVLATPPALDLLDPTDHAVVRTCAEETRSGTTTQRLTLTSGRTVRLQCTPIDGTDGALVDIVAEREGDHDAPEPSTRWPLLVVGETGSGRTTEARRLIGLDGVTLEAPEIVRQGEQAWAAGMGTQLDGEGPAVIVEDVQLLSEPMTALLAKCLRSTTRKVVLTSTPGDHLDSVHAPLVALCDDRRDLLPLRRRSHEIPQLAQQMLADICSSGRTRLTCETMSVLASQPWPGNLAELRRVIQSLAAARSAGDIIPSDLPESHRGVRKQTSPFRDAEREVIVAALETAGGNKLKAARALGVSRSTLYNRMRALHIH